jgi:hypothetical protein
MEDFGFGMTGIARARKAVSGIVKVANAGGAHMILVVLTARFVLCAPRRHQYMSILPSAPSSRSPLTWQSLLDCLKVPSALPSTGNVCLCPAP